MERGGRRIATALLLTTLLFAGGCKSLEHAFSEGANMEVYGGTRDSWEYVTSEYTPFGGTVFHMVDLPFTAVMDTLLLPISIPMSSGE